jgi:1-acyl-sn-glycerol-3-phosphate acyltransferase
MNIVFRVLHTVISRLLVALIIMIIFVPLVICLLVPDRWRMDNPFIYVLGRFFYWGVLKAALVPVTYKGVENFNVDVPSIIVANHQSSLDIPLIGNLMGIHQHTWLATSDLLKSALFRYLLPRTCSVVDVSSPVKAMRSLIKAMAMVNGKSRHIIIFPEGGRFDDNEVHDFYGGFVVLAKKMGRPVVPVRLFHVNQVYPRNSFLAQWHPVTVVVGKPFKYEETDTEESFRLRVQQWFHDQKS